MARALLACGGSATQLDSAAAAAGGTGGTPGGAGGSAQGGSGGSRACTTTDATTPIPPHVPASHRAVGDTCAKSGPACPGVPSVISCTSDKDCASPPPQAGCNSPYPGAHCVDGGCVLDACLTDGDCAAGEGCSCRGKTRGWGGSSPNNQCITAGCRTDADCGAGGYCSPSVSFGVGAFYGVRGYYCHTAADTCVDDGDCCVGYCAYSPEVGRWACGISAAAGLG